MLDTDELLARLEEKRVRNIDIARTLGLPDSRVPEIKQKRRKLSLDEGAKLVRAFSLEQGPEASPIPAAVNRLIVRHVAASLGVCPDEARLEDLSEDLRAFSEFVSDPKVRQSLEAAESFFRAMHLRRPGAAIEARQESDPPNTH